MSLSVLSKRYGHIGAVLADNLSAFSYDLVGLILDYAVCKAPTTNALPALLLSVDLPSTCWALAISPRTGHLWVGLDKSIMVMSTNGPTASMVDAFTFNRPCGIAFDNSAQETTFVADVDGVHVLECASKPTLARELRSSLLTMPIGVACGANDTVLVPSASSQYVTALDKHSGSVVSVLTVAETARGLATSSAGDIFVAHAGNAITVLDKEGKRQREIGAGVLKRPRAIAFDRDENLYVADSAHNRVVVFKQDGACITTFGDRKEEGKGSSAQVAAVDIAFPHVGYRVYEDDGDIYEATLQQTHEHLNMHKFYIIQLLEADGSGRAAQGRFLVWLRWGRVGKAGQSYLTSYPALETAKTFFMRKFLDKTNQLFVNRADFVTPEKPGTRCYNLIERVEPGVLSLPVAVCVDMEGRIYVRQNRERVSVFGF